MMLSSSFRGLFTLVETGTASSHPAGHGRSSSSAPGMDEVETALDDAHPKLRRKEVAPGTRMRNPTKYTTRYETVPSSRNVVLARQGVGTATLFVAQRDLPPERLAAVAEIECHSRTYGVARVDRPTQQDGPGYNSNAATIFGTEDVYEFVTRTVEEAKRIIDVVAE
jgi:hypothetical protein